MQKKTEKAGAVEPMVSRLLGRAIRRLEVLKKEYPQPKKMIGIVDHAIDFIRSARSEHTCEWSRGEDFDDETWSTSCGQEFILHEEATPLECQFNYCAFCGRRIKEQITRGECD